MSPRESSLRPPGPFASRASSCCEGPRGDAEAARTVCATGVLEGREDRDALDVSDGSVGEKGPGPPPLGWWRSGSGCAGVWVLNIDLAD